MLLGRTWRVTIRHLPGAERPGRLDVLALPHRQDRAAQQAGDGGPAEDAEGQDDRRHAPARRTRMMTMAPMIRGKAKKTSATRMMTASHAPPR